jgi:hypothetical protein
MIRVILKAIENQKAQNQNRINIVGKKIICE